MNRLLAATLLALFVPSAFAAGRELAPRPLIPKSGFFDSLSVASAGDRFLTVWRERHPRSEAIHGVLSDVDGRRLSPAAFLLVETAQVRTIHLAGTGDSFAMFWTDDAKVVHLTNIDLDGGVIDTRATALPSADRLSVAWDGERFLAVIFRPSGYRHRVVAALLDRDGTMIRGEIPLGADAATTATHIAVNEEGFIVFTGSRSTFFAHVISDDGTVTMRIAGDPAAHIVSTPIGAERLLVVSSMTDGQLRAAVWRDGGKVSETTVTVNRAGIAPIQLMSGDGRHLLVFAIVLNGANTISAMHLDDDGRPASEPVAASETGALPPPGASNGRVAFVPHQATSSSPIASVTFDRHATIGATETLSIHPAAQSHVLLGAGGGSMVAVWNERTGDGSRIRSAVIGRDFESHNVRELAPDGVLRTRQLAWNGTEHLILYQTRDGRLQVARLTHDGMPIGEPAVIGEATTPVSTAAVTWAGDRWAIVWISPYADVVRYATVSRGGIASLPRELQPTSDIFVDVALTFDGSRVHLAWVAELEPAPRVPQGSHVFTTRLRPDGRIVDETPLAIPAWGPRHVSMATNGSEVALLVNNLWRTDVHMISTTRQILSTRTLLEWLAEAEVTWDGFELIAAAGYRGARSYAATWRLGDDGTGTDAPRGTATIGSSSVSVAASPGYSAVLGMSEWDAATGARAVLYAERELPRIPDPPPPPTNVRARAIDVQQMELNWDPPAGGAEIYEVEERRTNGAIGRGPLIDAATRVLRSYAVAMRIRSFRDGVPSAWSEWAMPQSLPRRRAARP
ncbi:MAG: hypothetical protein ACXW5U_14665 [Thermoanaerobaculia bacterium]